MIGAGDLQQMIFELLSNDTELSALLDGPKIYDTPPRRSKLPFISFGALTETNWSVSEESGSAYIVTLNCWSQKAGRKQALAIAARVHEVLGQDTQFGPDASANLVIMQPLGTDVQHDIANDTIRATARFRALVETAQ